MANPVKGEVPLEVGGTRYVLVLGTYALASLERRQKQPWTKIIRRAVQGDWGVDDVLAIAHAGLLRHQRQITEEQVADLIDEIGVQRMTEIIGEALRLMQPESGNGGAPIEQNPTKPGNGHGTNLSATG